MMEKTHIKQNISKQGHFKFQMKENFQIYLKQCNFDYFGDKQL